LGHRVLSCRAARAEAKLSYAALSDLLAEPADEILPSLPAPQRRALEVAMLRVEPELGFAALAAFCVCQKDRRAPPRLGEDELGAGPKRGRSSTESISAPRLRQETIGVCSASMTAGSPTTRTKSPSHPFSVHTRASMVEVGVPEFTG
jgi:hypothetical protein